MGGKQPQTKEISNLHRNLPNVVPLSRGVKMYDHVCRPHRKPAVSLYDDIDMRMRPAGMAPP